MSWNSNGNIHRKDTWPIIIVQPSCQKKGKLPATVSSNVAHWEMLYKWIVQWEEFESHSGFSSKPCLMTQTKGRSYNAWFHFMVILWMVAKSCTTWDGRTPINNGINHVFTDAGFRKHPLYFMRHVIGKPPKRQLNLEGNLGISWKISSMGEQQKWPTEAPYSPASIAFTGF